MTPLVDAQLDHESETLLLELGDPFLGETVRHQRQVGIDELG